jgi:hypothetical protein
LGVGTHIIFSGWFTSCQFIKVWITKYSKNQTVIAVVDAHMLAQLLHIVLHVVLPLVGWQRRALGPTASSGALAAGSRGRIVTPLLPMPTLR